MKLLVGITLTCLIAGIMSFEIFRLRAENVELRQAHYNTLGSQPESDADFVNEVMSRSEPLQPGMFDVMLPDESRPPGILWEERVMLIPFTTAEDLTIPPEVDIEFPPSSGGA